VFSLGRRLSLCAGLLRPQAALADIGTDHAYLPVWLARQGRISRAVAADVRPGPLKYARRNIERYGVGEIVSARLSDGLSAIRPEEADDIVMAGMGGLLITRIIAQAPWLKNSTKHLILQPMTSVEDLRRFLSQEGFAVCREQAVSEEGHIYTVMLCIYDSPGRVTGELYPYIGILKADTEDNRLYLLREMKRLQDRARGLQLEGNQVNAERLLRIRGRIQAMFPRQE
jgi:tRNA (adenine22-N1)-methyltransferase